MNYSNESVIYKLCSSQTRSDLERSAGHLHLVIVLLLFKLDDTLMVTGYDARESRYNINQELLALSALSRTLRGVSPNPMPHDTARHRPTVSQCEWKESLRTET